MKKSKRIALQSTCLIALNYVMFSFYYVAFDISEWSETGRGMYVFLTMFGMLAFTVIEKIESN